MPATKLIRRGVPALPAKSDRDLLPDVHTTAHDHGQIPLQDHMVSIDRSQVDFGQRNRREEYFKTYKGEQSHAKFHARYHSFFLSLASAGDVGVPRLLVASIVGAAKTGANGIALESQAYLQTMTYHNMVTAWIGFHSRDKPLQWIYLHFVKKIFSENAKAAIIVIVISDQYNVSD